MEKQKKIQISKKSRDMVQSSNFITRQRIE